MRLLVRMIDGAALSLGFSGIRGERKCGRDLTVVLGQDTFWKQWSGREDVIYMAAFLLEQS